MHAEQYLSLLQTGFTSLHNANANANANAKLVCFHGPAFTFPETDVALPRGPVAAVVSDESVLHRHFRGWAPGEIAAGRAPVLALLEDGHAVSICFCARRSDAAAEAGLETAPAYRRRGFAKRVTAAWARAVRESGRAPLYSTSWNNVESLAVARRLGLTLYACDWSVSD
jgi:GNAT superfamily N-acetyltransferase